MTLLTARNINTVIFPFIELKWIKTELNHSEYWLYWIHTTLKLLFSGLLNWTESLWIITLLTARNINTVIFRFIELNWIKTELNHSE